jgi:hypothetical protein
MPQASVPWSVTFAVILAESVKLHGARPWHRGLTTKKKWYSDQREIPRDKPVASLILQSGLEVRFDICGVDRGLRTDWSRNLRRA